MKNTALKPAENVSETPQKVRSRTLSRKQMAREHSRERKRGELLNVLNNWHPQARSECRDQKRPCLFVSCRHHLYLDVNPQSGSVKYNFPDKEVWELEETCALDVAERGGITLEEVGRIMNLTRERVRQIELDGIGKLRQDEVASQSIDGYTTWDGHAFDNDPDSNI